MSVLSLIKENRIFVAGLVLPFFLILLLAYAKTIPGKTVPAPLYNPVYYNADYNGWGTMSFRVADDGSLEGRYTVSKEIYDRSKLPSATIYTYDVTTGETRSTPIALTDSEAKEDRPSFPVAAFKGVQFYSGTTSPDHYVFEPYDYRDSGLFSDLFISSSRQRGPNIAREGRVIRVAPDAANYYGNVQFIGWIRPDSAPVSPSMGGASTGGMGAQP